MKELLLMMADVMPIDEIVNQLHEATTEYKATQSEDSKKRIGMYSMLYGMKEAIEIRGSASEVIADMKNIVHLKTN